MIPAPLVRLAYKAANLAVLAGSLVLRPRTRGVKCLVCCAEDVLLVRHSYGRRQWDLPGGYARRGEPFADAARRELGEELHLDSPRGFAVLGELHRRNVGRHETLGAIRVEVGGRAAAVRGFELREARWFARGALPEPRADVIDAVLELEPGLSRPAQG